MNNEDNDLLCRQLLRIAAQVRAGAHVENSNVSVARAGTLTIYTVSVSVEDPPPSIFKYDDPSHGRFEYDEETGVTYPAGNTGYVQQGVQPSNNPILNQRLREEYGPLKGDPQ